MGKDLYETDEVFRANLDRCAALVDPHLPRSMLGLIYPQTHDEATKAELQGLLSQARYQQPILFSLGYSLAQSLIKRGVSPDMVLGHSLGEYVAATIAGVKSLEVGLALVVARARLMQDTPSEDGVMAALLPVWAWWQSLQRLVWCEGEARRAEPGTTSQKLTQMRRAEGARSADGSDVGLVVLVLLHLELVEAAPQLLTLLHLLLQVGYDDGVLQRAH
mmetsp:Transcript_36895/g.105711  ORF Transcript_36895/g.105711 Transcript_36895/m.105711 type:complete len:219 (-) Transcript_36895:112-768(-)